MLVCPSSRQSNVSTHIIFSLQSLLPSFLVLQSFIPLTLTSILLQFLLLCRFPYNPPFLSFLIFRSLNPSPSHSTPLHFLLPHRLPFQFSTSFRHLSLFPHPPIPSSPPSHSTSLHFLLTSFSFHSSTLQLPLPHSSHSCAERRLSCGLANDVHFTGKGAELT